MQHRDSTAAFTSAIAAGVLSADAAAPNHAGKFMYMGTERNRDLFKHIDTREYVESAVPLNTVIVDTPAPETAYVKGKNGWKATTEYPMDGNRVLSIRTNKGYRGGVSTHATVFTDTGTSRTHAFGLANDGSGDYSETTHDKRDCKCTEKSVREQHADALNMVPAILDRAKAHYAAQDAKKAASMSKSNVQAIGESQHA